MCFYCIFSLQLTFILSCFLFSFLFSGEIIFTEKSLDSIVLHFDSKHFLNIPFRLFLISFLLLMWSLLITHAKGILKHVSEPDFISAKLSQFDNFLLTSSSYGRLCRLQCFNPRDSQSSGLSSSSFLVELNVSLDCILSGLSFSVNFIFVYFFFCYIFFSYFYFHLPTFRKFFADFVTVSFLVTF